MAPSCHPSGVLGLILPLWDALEPAAMLSWMIPCSTVCSALGHGAGIRTEQRLHQLTRQLTTALGCTSHLSCSLAPSWQPGMQKQHGDTLLPVCWAALVPSWCRCRDPAPGTGKGVPTGRVSGLLPRGVMLKPATSISDFRLSC